MSDIDHLSALQEKANKLRDEIAFYQGQTQELTRIRSEIAQAALALNINPNLAEIDSVIEELTKENVLHLKEIDNNLTLIEKELLKCQ